MNRLNRLTALALLALAARGASGADLTADEIVSRANRAFYYAGKDGRSDVVMTIHDAQGGTRSRGCSRFSRRSIRSLFSAGPRCSRGSDYCCCRCSDSCPRNPRLTQPKQPAWALS